MGRKLINKETRLQPAEYADGFISADVSITFAPRRQRDGGDGEDWARNAALRVYDSLAEDFGTTSMTALRKGDRETKGATCSVTAQRGVDGGIRHLWTVRLATGKQDETGWHEDFWDEDGGVWDWRRASDAFKVSVEKLIREILCEDEKTAGDDNFIVVVNDFNAWQQ